MKAKPIGFVVVFTLAVGGCTGKGALPQKMKERMYEYNTAKHMKAIAGAFGNARAGYSFGWAWDRETAEKAIEDAMRQCEGGKTTSGTPLPCRVYFIGDQNVASMSQSDKDKILKEYNRSQSWHETGGAQDGP